ncbi:hypothetical protein SADUNF_Sadunf03G0045200 [Salix dunnii]|uniref:Uncharacterized protein n=1 Tax=Salix dunnii TaxID=1413687 RepID=A0A835KDD0_9ROSI|nr:hypothetical protein SADUNF_Sadunf03G0045200 [Salix dunnii]
MVELSRHDSIELKRLSMAANLSSRRSFLDNVDEKGDNPAWEAIEYHAGTDEDPGQVPKERPRSYSRSSKEPL